MLLATLSCLLAAVAHGPVAVPAHPLDGPDVDLRLAIHDRRVTLHVVMNLAFVDELVAVPRLDPYALPAAEQPAVEAALAAWCRANVRLALDGVAVAPTPRGFGVDPGDLRLLPMFPIMGSKALIKVRLQLHAEGRHPPQTVGLVWPGYPTNLAPAVAPAADTPAERDATPRLPIALLVTNGGTEQVVTLRHDEPEFTWHAPRDGAAVRLLPVPQPPPAPRSLPLPLASLGLLLAYGAALPTLRRRRWRPLPTGLAVVTAAWLLWPMARIAVPLAAAVALPTVDGARRIFAALHTNLYRAFDEAEPAAVYDALASSVQGDLLDTTYHDVYRSLVMLEEGGAVARVRAVRPLELEVEQVGVLADDRTPSFTVRTRWQVDAAVFHWGHHHWRTDEHVARYTVIATEAGWRIAGTEPIEQRRLAAGAGTRASEGEGTPR